MKIAILIHDYTAMGGTERVTIQLCNQLALRHSVTLISVQRTDFEPAFPVCSNVDIVFLGNSVKSMIKTLPQKIKALRDDLKKTHPDVVISSDSQMALLSLPASVGLSCHNVIWEHFNASIETRFGSRWFARRLASMFADKIVVLTEQDRVTWLKKFQCKSPLVVFPNPCALPKPASNPYNNVPVVLAAGRYTEQKGFDYLVKAWRMLSAQQRKGWVLRIVGPNGSAKSDVVSLAANDSSIQIDGPSENMANCYLDSGIFVCSSRYEGFGLTIVEARTHGIPVIVFDCAMGPAEIVGNDHGKVVPVGNIDALSKQLAVMIGSADERRYYSDKSFKRAADFTPEVTLMLWEKMLDALGRTGKS